MSPANLPKPLPKMPAKLPPRMPPAALPANPVAAPSGNPPKLTAPPAIMAKPAPGAAKPANPQALDLPAGPAAMAEALHIYESILIEENALLRRQNVQGVTALLDRKQKATVLYQERLRGLVANDGTMKSLSPEQKAGLATLANRLQTHLVENAALLKASMNAVERMFGAINDAVRKDREKQLIYSQGGLIAGQPASNSAVAFNGNA